MKSQIDAIKKEYGNLKAELEKPGVVSDGKKMKEIGKRLAELEGIAKTADELEHVDKEMRENAEIVNIEQEEEL
ncbi:MAG: PCRF domain-containing protein, partial [Candidatus Moranbacteria bacterium]|nr:PCRF domain-containing protein [Candidatus Moranbacteria bacterium]